MDIKRSNTPILICTFHDKAYAVDPARGIDISIPVRPNAPDQIRAFADAPASMELIAGGVPSGNVGFNCPAIQFSAHLNGTHTEGKGHISDPYVALDPDLVRTLNTSYLPATLLTVDPVPGAESGETYARPFASGDRVITRASLVQAFGKAAAEGIHPLQVPALAIRTLPNGEDKKTRCYEPNSSAFFTTQAMEYLASHAHLQLC